MLYHICLRLFKTYFSLYKKLPDEVFSMLPFLLICKCGTGIISPYNKIYSYKSEAYYSIIYTRKSNLKWFGPNFPIANILKLKETFFVFFLCVCLFFPFLFASSILESSSRNFTHSVSWNSPDSQCEKKIIFQITLTCIFNTLDDSL